MNGRRMLRASAACEEQRLWTKPQGATGGVPGVTGVGPLQGTHTHFIFRHGGFADRLFTLSSILLLSSVLGKLYFRACRQAVGLWLVYWRRPCMGRAQGARPLGATSGRLTGSDVGLWSLTYSGRRTTAGLPERYLVRRSYLRNKHSTIAARPPRQGRGQVRE